MPENIPYFQYGSNTDQLVGNPEDTSLKENQVIDEWNKTDGDYPFTKTLHQIFEEEAERSPNKLAIICRETKLSYQELNDHSNQLAHYLSSIIDLHQDTLIALFLDKNEAMIISILGVWKSGCAYVPIDPSYPDDQIKFILEDTQASAIVVNQHHASRLMPCFSSNNKLKVVEIESFPAPAITQNPISRVSSSNLAYITYTSGTTGRPKGVMKEHKSVVNSILDLASKYKIQDGSELIALFSAYVFEPFLRQMLLALLNSQTLVIVNDEEKQNPFKFNQFLKQYGITFLNGTASVLQEYDYSLCPTLSKLSFAGEELTKLCYEKIRQTFKGTIINEYGPTESAFVTSYIEYEPNGIRSDRSIGKPLKNVKCYVLDSMLQQVPVLEIGELFIGGIGVSRGYLNRPELTLDRFLVNPFQTKKEKLEGWNDRIYKTGDLVRWLPNGNLEYLGRNDLQIKLNGIRIEPSEIESVLSTYPGIKHCIITAKESKNSDNSKTSKYLVGYYVSDGVVRQTENDLLEYLKMKLPKYMIPARLVQIESIPVTINGKLDARALPDINILNNNMVKFQPKNHLEWEMRQLFSDILDLPLEQLCVTDDFFRLGGDSIKSIQLIGQIRKQLAVNVSLTDIFMLKNIENLAKHLGNANTDIGQDLQTHQTSINIQTLNLPNQEIGKNIEAFYMANNLQQGFMFHYLKQSDIDDAYIVQSVHQYKTYILVDQLKKAWEYALKKYCSLRLRFIVSEKDVIQIVDQMQTLDWRFFDISNNSDIIAKENYINQMQEHDRKERYQLEKGNLFRIYLIKQNASLFTFLFSCHHIILDGWSFQILFDYVNNTYLQLIQGEPVNITPDNSYHCAQMYMQAHQDDNIDYWTNQINQVQDRCDLNGLLKEEHKYKITLSNYDHIKDQKEKTLMINGDLNLKLKEMSLAHGITLHSILQFALHKFLSNYGNSSHTIVGTIVSGRNIPVDNIENSVGLYINTLPLIVDHEKEHEKCVIDAIKEIQSQVNIMNSRSHVELARLNKGEMKHSLFDSLFVLENYANFKQARACSQNELLQFEAKYTIEKLDYPLAFVAREIGKSISLTLFYAGELFEEDVVAHLLSCINILLYQIVSNHDQPVTKLEFLSLMQKKILHDWNQTTAVLPSTKMLHQIFEVVAESCAKKVAIVFEKASLTYQELNKQSNQLAHYLRSINNIQPDSLIALLLDKSELMIISIFAIWKSGAAYVPIDPSYTDKRIQFILEDTKTNIIITNKCYASRLQQSFSNKLNILQIESLCAQSYTDLESQNPQPISTWNNLAYVIYTSGTTGNPKGVMVEHIGVVNLQLSLAQIFSLQKNKSEVILSFSNYVFDHFVEQMTNALLNGQTLVILNDEMRTDKQRLYNYISKNKVTYLSGTPSVLQLYEYDTFKHSITRIDAVGEDFSEMTFNKIRSTFGGLIINGYGPTEVSITSHKRLYPVQEKRKNKSIGRQISNITCYVLNRSMKQVPIGAVGELFIGGIGVARGYLNRPELTADRFLVNPFQTELEKLEGKNARIYKTGDLVRWLSNGEIEYLGRNDSQVKIRGLRIELGEIESILSKFPGIKQAIVVAKVYPIHDNKDTSSICRKCLVGYFTSDDNLIEKNIKKFLQAQLPEYMIPNRLVRIDKVPVTINGKLDTKSLPDIQISESINEYTAPRNEIQNKLCHIWSDLLDIPAENISINDDFFSLGGDSLMVQRLFFRISNFLSCGITVATIFQHKTIEAISNYIINEADMLQTILSMDNHKSVVSFAQESLLFIDEYHGGTNAYNISMHIKLPLHVDKHILEKSLLSVILRHETLRTSFVRQDPGGGYLQQLFDEDDAKSMFVIARIAVNNSVHLDHELVKASEHIFNLKDELPIKVVFYESAVDTDSYIMSIVLHHICFDGWSWRIFQRDLGAYYHFHQCNTNSAISALNLPALNIQYKDFAVWQRKTFTEMRLKNLLDFWKPKLDGFETLKLNSDFPRPMHIDYSGNDIHFELDKKMMNCLKKLAVDLKVSMFSVLVSAYCFTLSIYSNQHDIVIGMPVANRNHPELENLIGFFVNILVLRVKVDPTCTVASFIQSVSEEVIKAQIHQDMPFEKLVNELNVEKDLSRHPIVQVVFSYNPYDATVNSSPVEDGSSYLEMSNYYPVNDNFQIAKYDMSTTVNICDNCIKGCFNYSAKLFNESTVKGYIESFTHILKQFTQSDRSGECKLANISLVDNGRLEKFMEYAIREFPMNKTLHQIFQEEVEKVPKKVAVIYKETMLTYHELNSQSNQLAHFLQSLTSIQPNTLIALFLDKSEFMIISILGVWKAGAAYVPIDPSYPEERIKFILQDTKAEIVIANHQYASRLSAMMNKSFFIVEVDSCYTTTLLRKEPMINCKSNADENSLAYVIYTSGTTGKPKGVLIEHKGVVNLHNDLVVRYFGEESYCDHQQAVLFLSNYVFDFSIEQLILSILNSNKLILVDSNWPIDDQFYDYLNINGLSYLSGTPTHMQQIDLTKLKYLQTVTVAGEAFTKSHFEKIRKEFDGTIINAYGITETTVYNMISEFKFDDKYKNSLGKLLSNMKKFVLNDSLQLLPPGAIGELYLAGNCLAQGYLGQPELTAQKFLPNPFQNKYEKKVGNYARIYKSGDLVCYKADGELEYLGRNDLQVKIHGLRIELNEIEIVLSSFPGITQCAILANDKPNMTSDNKYLVGYFVSQDNQNISATEIKLFMQNKLPNYMIPAALVQIENKLPITINGKLDKRALPIVDFLADKDSFRAPRNVLEKQLCQIWSELLRIPKIGIDDDFFQLGGDSILSQQLCSRIRHELNVSISVKDVFVFKSIQSLVDNVLGHKKINCLKEINIHAEQGILTGILPMLPIQDWFFSKNLSNCNHWNQSFAIRTPQLNLQKLKDALVKLVQHHNAFLLRFKKQNDDSYTQYYDDRDSAVILKSFNVGGSQKLEEVLMQWQKGLDIENGPLFCIGYLHGYEDGSARVWFSMHHLIVDTVSWQIICRDLETLYNGGDLGLKSSSYRQWVMAVQQYSLHSETERVFWQNLADKAESFNRKLATFINNKTQVYSNFTLTTEQTENVLRRCNQVYGTQINDLLLTALAYALKEVTQDRMNYVTVEGHGREEIDNTVDVSQTVGWFTTMYPVELNIGDNLRTSIQHVKDHLNLDIQNKGIGYGPIVGYSKGLPLVSFNYLGQFDSTEKSKAWNLVDVSCGCKSDRSMESQEADKDIVSVTGLCYNGHMRFTIASRLDVEKTDRISSVFKSTLEEIIKDALDIADFETYVEFTKSNETILFVLPPGEGGAESYFNNIACKLTSFRLILFNNYYLHMKKSPTTFEELAKFYIHYIRQIQPHGPYNFLGWSFGGVLSFEISQQLIEAGEKVDNLIFIDSYFNVQKACQEIDRTDGYIIDRINYLYSDSYKKHADFCKSVKNIILFQASKLNNTYRSNNEKLLYEYYMQSPYNNLDTVIDRQSIQIIKMKEDTHTSWVKNERQLTDMADYILSLF